MTKKNTEATEARAVERFQASIIGVQALEIEMAHAGLPVEHLRPLINNGLYLAKCYAAEKSGVSFYRLGELLDELPGDDDGDAEALFEIRRKAYEEARAAQEVTAAEKH